MKILSALIKNLLKNRNLTFPVVLCCTWKLELVWSIWWMVVDAIQISPCMKIRPLKLKFIHMGSFFVNAIFFVNWNQTKLKPEFPISRNCVYSQPGTSKEFLSFHEFYGKKDDAKIVVIFVYICKSCQGAPSIVRHKFWKTLSRRYALKLNFGGYMH